MKLLNREARVNSKKQIIFTEAYENNFEDHLILNLNYS